MSVTWNPNTFVFSLFCQTENKTVRGSITSTTQPVSSDITTCPNNAAHTILANSAVLDHSFPGGFFEKYEVAKDDLVRQNWVQSIDIQTENGQDVNIVEKSWLFPVVITATSFVGLDEFQGDKLVLEYDPDRNMGHPTSDVVLGSNVITVSVPASMQLRPGNFVRISDGTNSSDMGYVLAIDTVAHTITCEKNSQFDFVAGSTFIYRSFRLACMEFLIPSYFPFSETFVGGGRYVPTGIKFRITHYNITGGKKRAQAMLQMLI